MLNQQHAPYLESLPAAYATIIKNSLQTVSVFDIYQTTILIEMVLSLTRTLQTFNVSGNNLPAESIIKIHDSESRGQEEAGRTRRTSELFTRSTALKFVNALYKPP